MDRLKIGISSLVVVWLLGFGFWSLPAGAMGGPAPKAANETKGAAMAEKVFLVDDFESGNLKSPREWWTFDLEKIQPISNANFKDGDEKVAVTVGNYSLLLSGPAKNWYAGGCGTYLAKPGQDLSKYTNFQMDVYGNGPGSGSVKIELIDDDDNNWMVEQDPAKNYVPTKDDRWVYSVNVDWSGWKLVSVPFADFVVDNPGSGDGIWNIEQTNGSGGLLQMQLVCTASTATGTVNMNIDNVALTMGEK